MRIVITGGAGFIGRKLALQLLKREHFLGGSISEILVFDIAPLSLPFPEDSRLRVIQSDFTDPSHFKEITSEHTAAIFHLAAIVSGAAEQDFDLGMRVNLHNTLQLLEGLRLSSHTPHFVFASSVAAFGGILPEVVKDDTALNPQTSYGTQKAITELLIDDYTRRGFIKGCALRLPTIVVRPGKPNLAASSFASSIIREPLQGQECLCPVRPDTKVCILSPRQVVNSFIHAAELPSEAWGFRKSVTLPGLSLTVQSMIDALCERAGENVAQRIRWKPDADIERIVYGWPVRFDTSRAEAMGFRPDSSVAEIIESFIADDLNGVVVP